LRALTVDDGVETAVVFLPDGKASYFQRRLNQYRDTLQEDAPRHRALLDTTDEISLATVHALWTDRIDDRPGDDEVVWLELWLRRRPGELDRFADFAEATSVQLSLATIRFRDRLVLNARCSLRQLSVTLNSIDEMAEIRRPATPMAWLASEQAFEQRDWVDDLLSRTQAATDEELAVALLDSGVQFGHPLLNHSLRASDAHTLHQAWGLHDAIGHGTTMAGIALYGDVAAAAATTSTVRLRHRLESVKILNQVGHAQASEVYGAVTANAVARLETQAPTRRRVFSLATTAEDVSGERPTAWSAAIDALAVGAAVDVTATGVTLLDDRNDRAPRLFVVSAGNVRSHHLTPNHLDVSDLRPIEDPAQAWNALTVGAYTESVDMQHAPAAFHGYTALAAHGELSPFSRTSTTWPAVSVLKPDIVMEGGNAAIDATGSTVDHCAALETLTTRRMDAVAAPFTTVAGTSPATAAAAHLAAAVMAEYPQLWPETVRALVVQSARWTGPMSKQIASATTKQAKTSLLRRYGMGVPSLVRATRSASDSLTLVVQQHISPFSADGRLREMHRHRLPWPVQVLQSLGATEVDLRVTLSYFIEPNPSRRGWQGRYGYASHGLRFDVRRPTETSEEMNQRLNKLADDLESGGNSAASDGPQWVLGSTQRVRGSLHSDVWRGSAAELASRGEIAVFPVGGWTKEAKSVDREELKVRYALIVSIESAEIDLDLWADVAAQINVPIEVTL
jgi:hypothetical protein